MKTCETDWNCVCHNAPCYGLDCGVYLPGEKPRKLMPRKSPSELRAIRLRAWATRRAQHAPREEDANG